MRHLALKAGCLLALVSVSATMPVSAQEDTDSKRTVESAQMFIASVLSRSGGQVEGKLKTGSYTKTLPVLSFQTVSRCKSKVQSTQWTQTIDWGRIGQLLFGADGDVFIQGDLANLVELKISDVMDEATARRVVTAGAFLIKECDELAGTGF